MDAFDMIVRCSERQSPPSGDSVWSVPPLFCERCNDPRHFSHRLCIGCRVKDEYALVMRVMP
jgi:hypothetical protein